MAKKRQRIDTLLDTLVWMRRKDENINRSLRGRVGHMKRLTKSEKLLNEQMLALLEWAAEHPKRWHDIGKLPETIKAAELLEQRGVIEIRQPMNQYRLKPAP
jgi:hypothetical protein